MARTYKDRKKSRARAKMKKEWKKNAKRFVRRCANVADGAGYKKVRPWDIMD